jgi:hypothetical protein
MDKFCETRDEWKANGRRGSVGAENWFCGSGVILIYSTHQNGKMLLGSIKPTLIKLYNWHVNVFLRK